MDLTNIYTQNVISTPDWLKNSKKNNENKHYSWNFINYSKEFWRPGVRIIFKRHKASSKIIIIN